MRQLVTTYSTLDWSADGTLVTKTRPAAHDARRRFRNELRVNRMLVAERPPVPTPRLVGHDVQGRRLTFEAVDGEPVGPKYPHGLGADQLEGIVDLALRLRTYRPRRRWLRRLDPVRRLRLAQAASLLTEAQADGLLPLAARARSTVRFAHGDITARNVLAGPGPGPDGGLALIDWEWAGLYPVGYDMAFLWYSLVDVPGARDQVERHVEAHGDVDQATFLLNALLVQLWHLHWYLPPAFRPKHLSTRDDLLSRLNRLTRPP
jgi:hypothetical protein